MHSDPVTNRLRWREVSEKNLRRTRKGYAIDLPAESELRTSLDAIRALAERHKYSESHADRVIVVPYSMSEGIRIDDAELGLKRPAQNLNRKGFP